MPLPLSGKALAGAQTIGLVTIGDLLEHLPRARREARTIAALTKGEKTTVVVEVRSIKTRPVRRRGMKPLVEATVADETGLMLATFFNQPWLATRYVAGTRLVLRALSVSASPTTHRPRSPRHRTHRMCRITAVPRGCPRRRSWR